jgi:hypothetical protein
MAERALSGHDQFGGRAPIEFEELAPILSVI